TALAGMSGLDGTLMRPGASAGPIRSALDTDASDEFVHGRLDALVLRLVLRVVLALAGAMMIVGLMVNAQASWSLRALTGGLALAGCAWLVRSSLDHLPAGMARSGGGLWSALKGGPK